MGVLHDKCREKLDAAYIISGITADVAQLFRAYLRNEKKGMRKNIKQIIKKLEKLSKIL